MQIFKKQIILLNKSSICTIDSFCLDVIRNNFYEIDISANARVADNTEMLLLKQEVLDDMFEDKYISGDKDFLDLIDTYTKYNKDEAPVTDKMMAWMGTQMNTMTDKSNSKIAELMIQGGDMGIIKCQKLLNHNPRADEPVKNILNDFVTLQKNDIEQMKKFL